MKSRLCAWRLRILMNRMKIVGSGLVGLASVLRVLRIV